MKRQRRGLNRYNMLQDGKKKKTVSLCHTVNYYRSESSRMYSSFLIIDCHYLYNCDMAGTVTFLFLNFPCIEWSCLHWIEMTIICYLVVSTLMS